MYVAGNRLLVWSFGWDGMTDEIIGLYMRPVVRAADEDRVRMSIGRVV